MNELAVRLALDVAAVIVQRDRAQAALQRARNLAQQALTDGLLLDPQDVLDATQEDRQP